MKIIALEGLDKSGKATQTELLCQKLKQNGINAMKSEFHRYDTPTGQLIRQFLVGNYDVPQEAIELIMAADKFAQVKWFQELEKQGVDVLILDRYTTSQRVYSRSLGMHVAWIEHILSPLREPDAEILLDISPEMSMERKGKYGDNDKYERNYLLLSNVRNLYLSHFKQERHKRIIVNGELSVEEISKQIYKFLQYIMNRRM